MGEAMGAILFFIGALVMLYAGARVGYETFGDGIGAVLGVLVTLAAITAGVGMGIASRIWRND